jgi:hypothetical protein
MYSNKLLSSSIKSLGLKHEESLQLALNNAGERELEVSHQGMYYGGTWDHQDQEEGVDVVTGEGFQGGGGG